MNWMGNQRGEGFKLFILMLGLVVSLRISGAGKFSFDDLISSKKAVKSYFDLSLTEEEAGLVNEKP
jgi:hypothetical protein